MSLNLNKNLKMYYSIGEVAKMFDVNESTLRFWEREFSFLRPKTKGASNVRQYSEKDIEQVRMIYNLVKVRGFKIAAAKKVINQNRTGADQTALLIEKLTGIKEELQKIKKSFDYLQ